MERNNNGAAQTGTSRWRFRLGLAMLVLSVFGPLVSIPVLSTVGLSGGLTASLSGAVLVGAELLMVAAVAVMGKEGYETIKGYLSNLLKRYGPPDEVSSSRYKVGLMMFLVPILFGWFSPYLQNFIVDLSGWSLALAIAGDLLLLSSLFILGGDFWDKLRSLFLHDARANFARS